MQNKIKAKFQGEDKCPNCGTAVSDTGLIISPWSWKAQVDAQRLKLAGERHLKTETGEPDPLQVPEQDAVRAVISLHGAFIHRCLGKKDDQPCNTSFLVTVHDPDQITVEAEA